MLRGRIARLLDVAKTPKQPQRYGGLRQPTRHASASPKQAATGVERPLWTTPRILLLTAFASAVSYTYGVVDTGSYLPELWQRQHAPKYGSNNDFQKVISELQSLLGEDAISTDEDDLQTHGFSEWSTVNSDRLPVAIAYPRSTQEVSQIAKVCHKYRMPMVPYSGGSSLEANFAAPHGGMTIDFAFMDKIIALHDDDMDVVVQPSIQWMELNERIKDSGLFFPVDPGPSARIGGMIGTSCSGTNAVRYGTMKDWVINLTVVLADGRVIKTRRRPRKSSAGYNLTGLFVGAEGTLGIVTEATLKLAVIPQRTTVGVVTFETIRNAAAAASGVMKAGVPVGAMELMDEVQMRLVNQAGSTGRTWKEAPTLFFKFSGTEAGASHNAETVKKIVREHGGGNIEFPNDEAMGQRLWAARKNSLWSAMALRDSGNVLWSTDVAVPFSRLAEIIEMSKKELDDLGLKGSVLGHVGDGNFHASILYDKNDEAQHEAVQRAVFNMVDRALDMEGTCTGEHGVGMGKKESLLKELGPETIEIMRGLKKALDPYWLLNPGKIFEAVNS